ncbi:MAG: hypothetical protein IJO60_09790 [Agathobacter sp.]|nr:hypothetical protein [Agathobacter sp.]
MKLYGVGNAVLHYREKSKLGQMQVCEGICNEMTMSRIETGEREFDALISETLLSRLGKTTNRFEFLLNDEDYYYYILRENIENAVEAGKFASAKADIAEYRKNIPDTHDLHEQFLLFYEAMIMKAEEKAIKDIVAHLYKAINLTRVDFLEPTQRLRLYSKFEIQIIYELLLYEGYSEDSMGALFRFVDELYDVEEKAAVLVPFLYYYGKKYVQDENWYELKKTAERAILYLQAGRTYLYITEFYFMKMLAEFHLYKQTDDWEERRRCLVQRCNEIYYMSMTIDDVEMMQKAECFCKEQLECQITM